MRMVQFEMYEAECERFGTEKRMDMGRLSAKLNTRWQQGWELDRIVEQKDNWIIIWKRNDDFIAWAKAEG
jgi:hypothetical protein